MTTIMADIPQDDNQTKSQESIIHQEINTLTQIQEKCKFILTRGKNTGQPCGKTVSIKGDEFCRIHISPKSDNGCQFILTRGDKKGSLCMKPIKIGEYCYSHSTEIEYKKCPSIIIRGERKGQVCSRRCNKNSDYCTIHREKNSYNK